MKQTHQKGLALFAFLSLTTIQVFAQGLMPSGMTGLAQGVLDVFTGPFVKVVLAIFLCGSAIAYGFNKDNEKIKRNAIAIGVAAAILIGAQSVVNAVWSASGGR
jgi:type IV secretory pathway VirB2 component (pilin)